MLYCIWEFSNVLRDVTTKKRSPNSPLLITIPIEQVFCHMRFNHSPKIFDMHGFFKSELNFSYTMIVQLSKGLHLQRNPAKVREFHR